MTAKELRDKLANVPDDTLVVIEDADTEWELHVTKAEIGDVRFTLSGGYGDRVKD
jgi:hypothetical protein